jgi:hypothetical protein
MSGERGAACFSSLEKIISACGRSASISFSAKAIAGEQEPVAPIRSVSSEQSAQSTMLEAPSRSRCP